MRKSAVWMSALVFIAAFLVRFIVYRFVTIPWIIFDEYVYIDLTRYIVQGFSGIHYVRDHLYPLGWPFVLAAFTGFMKDPFLQYRAGLFLTMVLSSLIPVGAYWFFKRRLSPALLLIIFPPLLVYSGNIQSETLYTLALFGIMAILKLLLDHDLHEKSQRNAGGVVIGLLLAFLIHVRSFGIVVVAGYVLAMLVSIWMNRHLHKERKTRVCVLLQSLGVFVVVGFLLSLIPVPGGEMYDKKSYVETLFFSVQHMPLVAWLKGNQFTLVAMQLFWVLPFSFIWGTYRSFREKSKTDFTVRLFVWFTLLFSFVLTMLHMLQDVGGNSQYSVFTRYLDPVLVLVAMYGIVDFVDYVKSGRKPHWIVFLSIVLFIAYSVFFLYKGSYKYGNTMGVYYVTELKSLFFPMIVFPSIAVLGACMYAFHKKNSRLALVLVTLLIIWMSAVSMWYSVKVPRYVVGKYTRQVEELKQYKKQFGFMPEMCHMGEKKLSDEMYYLYGFLNGRHRIAPCNETKPRPSRIVLGSGASAKDQMLLPISCVSDFRFSQGDVIYYCPQK